MVRRAEYYSIGCRLGRICAARPKFNESLNLAASQNGHRIMNVTTCDRPEHLDNCGNLSEKGKKEFWKEVDFLMERFDRDEIKLLPTTSRQAKKNRSSTTQSQDYQRHY